jgi:outer membrane receptor protein involved in Fe transport
MLRQAHGVRVNEFNLQGVASQVQIRGFNGGHGGEVGFYYDGIPLNDNGRADNYSDISILVPLEIESVEITKGPASASYGKGNAAGTTSFQGIKRGTFNRLTLKLGMYKTVDVHGIIAKDFENSFITSTLFRFTIRHLAGQFLLTAAESFSPLDLRRI